MIRAILLALLLSFSPSFEHTRTHTLSLSLTHALRLLEPNVKTFSKFEVGVFPSRTVTVFVLCVVLWLQPRLKLPCKLGSIYTSLKPNNTHIFDEKKLGCQIK